MNAVHVITSDAEAIEAAHRFARSVADGAQSRDRDAVHPVAELRDFARTGLLGISIPRALGGAGATIETLGEVLRIVACVDGSLSQVPQPHYVTLLAVLLAGTAEQRAFFSAEVLRGARFGNALSERGTRNSMALETTLKPDPSGGFRLQGRKFYTTGSLSADWVPTYALDTQGRMVIAYLPREAPGLQVLDDWRAMGQRGTASGTALFEDVHVDARHVVELWRLFEGPQIWGAYPRFLHAAIDAGLAEGALNAGAAVLRTRSRPWVEAGVDRAADEPHNLLAYGQLHAEVSAAKALLRRAGRALDAALADTSTTLAAAASAAVSEAKGYTADTAVRVATDIFAAVGTSAADDGVGLGRHWRDARLHTIHDPARWNYHAAGHYAAHGDFPRSAGHGGAAARPATTPPSSQDA